MNKQKLIKQAVHRAFRICNGLYGSDYKPNYSTPTSAEEVSMSLKSLLADLRANPRPCSVDIESMYCKEFGKKPLEVFHPEFHVWCIGFSIDDYQALCVPFDPHPYLIEKFNLCSIDSNPEILLLVNEICQLNCVTHSTIDALGLAQYGIRFADLDDSLLVQYAIDDREGNLSVKDLAKFHTEEQNYKTTDYDVPASMAECDFMKLMSYCCHDADIERRIFFILKEEAIEEDVWRGYNNVIKVSNMVGIEMTLNGCAMDFSQLYKIINDLEEEKAPLTEEFYARPELSRCFEYIQAARETEKKDSLRKKFESIQTLRDIKPSKSWCLEVLFYDVLGYECPKKTEKGARSVDEDTLELVKKKIQDPSLIDLMIKIKKIDKEQGTYLLPYIEPKGLGDNDPPEQQMADFISGNLERFPYIKSDGLIHPLFNFHKARSSRSSSENPNFQNVKNDIEIKSMFVARIWEAT